MNKISVDFTAPTDALLAKLVAAADGIDDSAAKGRK